MRQKQKPNILLIFADQLSMCALNIYGSRNRVHTPNIDSLAQNGVKFTGSYCSTPQCSPSRSSMLTGLYPHKTEVIGNIHAEGGNSLDSGLETMGSYLKKNGYKTGYFGKWHLGTPVEEFGFDSCKSYDMGDAKEDPSITVNVLDFLQECSDKSWFAAVSYENPHDIYTVQKAAEQGLKLETDSILLPESFNDDLNGKPEVQSLFRDQDQGKPLKHWIEEQWKYYIAYYNYLIESLDKEIGKILDKLKAEKQYEDTVIIFTSDHGDMLASHRCPYKGPMMYDELIRIPLIFSFPGCLPAGETRSQLLVNTDIFPTLCDLVEIELPEDIDGISMKECLFDEKAKGRDKIVVQYYSKQKWINPIRTIIMGNFKYNLYLEGSEELYDLAKDKHEIINQTCNNNYQKIIQELKDALLKWAKDKNDPFIGWYYNIHNNKS